MASHNKRNALIIGGAATVVVIAGLAFKSSSSESDNKIEPQNYVPTAEDIAHAEQVATDFYTEFNAGTIQYANDIKATSIDGEGRILPTQGDVFEIRSVPLKTVLYGSEEGQNSFHKIYTPTKIESHQSLWNDLLDPNVTQEQFDESHRTLLEKIIAFGRFDSIDYGTVSATYNIASGRICEIKAEILNNDKYNQDCYSITELTPGTQLAQDIDAIHKANPDRAPALTADMS